MKPPTAIILCLIVTFSALAASPVVAAAPNINHDNVKAFFDSAFALQTKEHRMAGVVVSVVYQGEVLFKEGYGFADIENRIPADPDTSLFRIASITKPFVWTAIMQLHEQGKLNIDDDVNEHLAAFKMPDKFDEPIRIRHLLTHTPGLEDQAIGMNARTIEETRSLERYLIENMPMRVRPPGKYASYSNWGASLAGYIVEQVSGQPWDDYVDENILSPLEMNSTNTHKVLSKEFSNRHAKSYVHSGGQYLERPFEAMNDTPAGVMSTTADDMTRFMLMHLNNGTFKGRQILGANTSKLMQSPLFEVHDSLPAMLHGFYRSDRNKELIFGHGGDINQFHSNLSLFPEHELGVFVSYNSDPSNIARSNVIPSFVDYFFPADYLREAPSPAPISLAEYEGEYIPLRSNTSTIERLGVLVNSLAISAIEGGLLVGGKSAWVPVAENEFVAKYVDRSMIFLRDDGNEITHVVIGSPLGTFEKVSGLDAPETQKMLIGLMALIAVLTVAGYGFRLFVPSRIVGLNAMPVMSAWSHGLLVLILYTILVMVLSGDVEEFVLGVPRNMHILLWIMNLNLILGLYVIWAAAQNWITGIGTPSMRLRFGLVGLMAIINFWVSWYFNILTYPFSGMQVIT
jgi:CubicO group peptidase (beta-lactamase class C family)